MKNPEESSNQIESLQDFKKIFLLEFTRELIKHSSSGEIFNLENILKEKLEQEKEELKKEKKKIKRIIVKKEKIPREIKKELSFAEKELPVRIAIKPIQKPIQSPRVLKIPETKLPPHLAYLKPTPTTNIEIDLGKLNRLIKDPAVRTIEVNPDEKVIVTGSMGRKPTNIILKKEEINNIIDKFSKISKIPVNEGVFRVVAGKLMLSAIISEVVGSKFIIRKLLSIQQNIKPLPKIPNPKYQIIPPTPNIIRR